MASCERCGAHVGEDSEFCTTCGTPVTRAELPTTELGSFHAPVRRSRPASHGKVRSTTDPDTMPWYALAGAGVIITAVIAAVVVFVILPSPKSSQPGRTSSFLASPTVTVPATTATRSQVRLPAVSGTLAADYRVRAQSTTRWADDSACPAGVSVDPDTTTCVFGAAVAKAYRAAGSPHGDLQVTDPWVHGDHQRFTLVCSRYAEGAVCAGGTTHNAFVLIR